MPGNRGIINKYNRMQDPIIYNFLIDKFAPALCWTLVHSLWEGLIFAVLASIVMVATKRSGPTLRYNALTCLFALFVLVAAATFVREWNHHLSGGRISGAITRVHTIILGETGSRPAGGMGTGTGVQSAEGAPLWQQMTNLLSDHALLIVTIWLFIVGVRVARTGYCIFYTQLLKTHRSYPPADYWVQRLASLCTSMGIHRSVMLLESEVMKIPAVFGHLKPVIFVPIGLLAQIPPSQVEAMLVHELAHIRRNDFLVNFLQGLIENIFFFNPAVVWISSLIREAREHCCDDIAIGQTKDKRQFIETLISLTERQVNNGPAYVLGFAGRRGGSAGRVERIVSNNNKTLNMKENFFLGLGLLLVGSLTLGFSEGRRVHLVKQAQGQTALTQQPKGVPLKQPQGVLQHQSQTALLPAIRNALPRIAQDTTPAGDNSGGDRYLELRINRAHDLVVEVVLKGVDYRFKRVNGEINDLFVDNKEIPKDQMPKYSETIEKICRNADDHFAHPDLDEEAPEARRRELMMEARKFDLAQQNFALAQEQYQKLQEKSAIQEESALQEKSAMEVNQAMALREKMARVEAEGMASQIEQLEKQKAILEERTNELKAREELLREKESELKKTIASIHEDLVKQHVVANGEEIKSLSLTKESLIVNDVKQPAAVHQYFRDKYLTGETSVIKEDGHEGMIMSDRKIESDKKETP
jgi:bla regulator protein BlaR1